MKAGLNKMKVSIIIELHKGITKKIKVFSNADDAEKYSKNWLKSNGYASMDEYIYHHYKDILTNELKYYQNVIVE